MTYCTLFDSNYLDKAIVTVNSLKKVDMNAFIYILCMDTQCHSIMKNENFTNVILIGTEEFEDEDLKKIKNERSRSEYIWTCTAKLLHYVLTNYNIELCTYIDADLMFLSNPHVLMEEMIENNCSVQVISHRFLKNVKGVFEEKKNGKHCVQFNTFSKNSDSIGLLKMWMDQCLKECSSTSAGDQMYINDWEKYRFVNISKNAGAGIAPWNIARFRHLKKDSTRVFDRYEKKTFMPVFYHFQHVVYIDRYRVKISPYIDYWCIDKKLLKRFYLPYLLEIEKVKQYLEQKYNFVPMTNLLRIEQEPKTRILKEIIMEGRKYGIPIIKYITFKMCKFLIRKIREPRSIIDLKDLRF